MLSQQKELAEHDDQLDFEYPTTFLREVANKKEIMDIGDTLLEEARLKFVEAIEDKTRNALYEAGYYHGAMRMRDSLVKTLVCQ
jgi:hypothetical protein